MAKPDGVKTERQNEVMTEVVEDTATTEDAETPETETPALTQADVDRIVKERLARERAKFSDYDDLKQAAARLAEIEESQKTEMQKAQEAADAARAEADALRGRIRQQAVITAAVQNGAVNPEQVAALVAIDDITDDGDSSAIGERVSEFLAANPHFVKASGAPIPAVTGNEIKGTPQSVNLDEIARMDPRELAKNPELLASVISARNNL